jgi:uncharacterized membrane protein (DUF441 family)
MRKTGALTVLLSLLPTLAFAETTTENPILTVLGKIILIASNFWIVLCVIIPILIFLSAVGTSLYFLKREQIVTGVVVAGIGVFFALFSGYIMVKSTDTVKSFAEKMQDVENLDSTISIE